PNRGSNSTQIAVATYVSIRLGDQRIGFGEKPIPLLRIGHLQGARYQLGSLHAQHDTGASIQWWIVGRQSGPPDLVGSQTAAARKCTLGKICGVLCQTCAIPAIHFSAKSPWSNTELTAKLRGEVALVAEPGLLRDPGERLVGTPLKRFRAL